MCYLDLGGVSLPPVVSMFTSLVRVGPIPTASVYGYDHGFIPRYDHTPTASQIDHILES